MHQSTLLDIARFIPVTPGELTSIKGFSDAKYLKYGDEILEICREFRKDS